MGLVMYICIQSLTDMVFLLCAFLEFIFLLIWLPRRSCPFTPLSMTVGKILNVSVVFVLSVCRFLARRGRHYSNSLSAIEQPLGSEADIVPVAFQL